jgi:hypothetical protein
LGKQVITDDGRRDAACTAGWCIGVRRAMLGKLSPKLQVEKPTRRQDCLLRSSFALAFFDLDLLLLLRDFRWLW